MTKGKRFVGISGLLILWILGLVVLIADHDGGLTRFLAGSMAATVAALGLGICIGYRPATRAKGGGVMANIYLKARRRRKTRGERVAERRQMKERARHGLA